ncbi:MAG: aminoglycoside phosphotransferase [Anaerocolumna sp.]|jgi:aminoglycoside phosphotransferase (APT) family kinase protein|nr:aminoglycoside phosphotransferase [Anaerocolumna sp.]
MISLTKNFQTEETIKAMVRKAFPNLEAIYINELKEGFFNVAYLIRLSDNREVILKIAPPKMAEVMSYEVNLMKAEVLAMNLVKEKTNVPVPDILYYSKDHEGSDNNVCEADYFFMTKLVGTNYNTLKGTLTEDEQYKIEYELGKYNREMNEINGDHFGYYASAKGNNQDWSSTFLSMISGVINDGKAKNIDIGLNYDELWNLVNQFTYELNTVKNPSFVHWDLWDGNVFIKDGHIEGIIDFERAIFGDPLMEYAFRSHNEGNLKGYMDAYGGIANDSNVRNRKLLYDIYLYLIMTVECEYRKYPDDWQYNWAKNMLLGAYNSLKTQE